jgi:hypothetical protein
MQTKAKHSMQQLVFINARMRTKQQLVAFKAAKAAAKAATKAVKAAHKAVAARKAAAAKAAAKQYR